VASISLASTAIENARTYEAERRARIAADADRARTEHLQKLTAELSRALSAEQKRAPVKRRLTRSLFLCIPTF
jgi:hypothetical protein